MLNAALPGEESSRTSGILFKVFSRPREAPMIVICFKPEPAIAANACELKNIHVSPIHARNIFQAPSLSADDQVLTPRSTIRTYR
jgi:hypothetical protein